MNLLLVISDCLCWSIFPSINLGIDNATRKMFATVGFLPRHSGSRRKRLMVSAEEATTQIFYVPPHKLSQFLEESALSFGDSRY